MSEIILTICIVYNLVMLSNDIQRINFCKFILICVFLFVIMNLGKIIGRVYIALLINYFTSFIVCRVFMCQNLNKSLIVSVFSHLTIMLGEFISVCIFLIIYGENLEMIKNIRYINILSNLFVSTIIIIIARMKFFNSLIAMIIEKINRTENVANIINYTLITVVGIVVTYEYHLFEKTSALGMIVCIIYAIFTIVLIVQIINKNMYRKSLLDAENRYCELKNHVELISELIGKLEKQKHDNKNNLIVLKSMIESKQFDNAEYMFEQLIGEHVDIENVTLSKFTNLKEVNLKYILMHKCIYAQNNNINIRIDIQKNVELIDLSKYDKEFMKSVYTAVGIILDNGIEATMNSEKSSIGIQMGVVGKTFNIYIINTFAGKIELKRIHDEGYSTKGKNRGYGLAILKEINDKYKTLISINSIIENNIFMQKIMIKKQMD